MQTKNCPICKCSFDTNHSRQVYCHKCLDFPDTGKVAVYALCQQGSTEVRYIGSTTNPVKRFLDHRRNGHGPEIKDWVESVNKSIEMTILEIVPQSKARTSEETQMRYHEKLGHRLLNKRAAGRMFTTEEAHEYIARWFKNK